MCELQSVDSTLALTDEDVETIVTICNEDLVYNMLFRERLNGQPYSRQDAQGFLSWAREGWQSDEWFVFLIRNSRNRIIGAIDIKTKTADAAEIGYWVSSTSPGIMTNTVLQLCDIAKVAGYKSLFALTTLENEKSARVLLRANFVGEGQILRNDTAHLKFTKTL